MVDGSVVDAVIEACKLRLRPMAPDCSRLLGDGEIIFDDPVNQPTLEGPKFLKRDGYYYIRNGELVPVDPAANMREAEKAPERV